MKRRLFLTGPMGCGKSTAIARALGDRLPLCGGFLTGRIRDASGRAVTFYLERPDTGEREVFLDFSHGKPKVDLAVFARLGVEALQGRVLVLDEIGGVELLCPEFEEVLQTVLRSDIPVLGVMKGEGPAGALIQALGLSEVYRSKAGQLRDFLREDADSLLYECGQFDQQALALAEQWTEEYLHE